MLAKPVWFFELAMVNFAGLYSYSLVGILELCLDASGKTNLRCCDGFGARPDTAEALPAD